MSGSGAENFRSYLENTSTAEVSRTLRDYYADYYQGATSHQTFEYMDDKVLNELTITESYELPEFFNKEENKVWAQLYHVGIWDKLRFPDHADRKTPYATTAPIEVSYSMFVDFPADTPFNFETAKQQFTSDGVHYESEAKGGAGVYSMDAKLSMTAESVEPAVLGKYIEAMQSIKEDSYYTLTFPLPDNQLAQNDREALLDRLKEMSASYQSAALKGGGK